MTTDLATITHCPTCGSTALGFFGMTEERTDDDITDIVECAVCKWTRTVACANANCTKDGAVPDEDGDLWCGDCAANMGFGPDAV
jgi:hypothetical protein